MRIEVLLSAVPRARERASWCEARVTCDVPLVCAEVARAFLAKHFEGSVSLRTRRDAHRASSARGGPWRFSTASELRADKAFSRFTREPSTRSASGAALGGSRRCVTFDGVVRMRQGRGGRAPAYEPNPKGVSGMRRIASEVRERGRSTQIGIVHRSVSSTSLSQASYVLPSPPCGAFEACRFAIDL